MSNQMTLLSLKSKVDTLMNSPLPKFIHFFKTNTVKNTHCRIRINLLFLRTICFTPTTTRSLFLSWTKSKLCGIYKLNSKSIHLFVTTPLKMASRLAFVIRSPVKNSLKWVISSKPPTHILAWVALQTHSLGALVRQNTPTS